MPEFKEVVQLVWDISQIQQAAGQASELVAKVGAEIEGLGGKWSTATVGATRFSEGVVGARREVGLLNARLEDTARLAGDAARAIAEAIGAQGAGGLGIEPRVQARDPRTGRYVSLRDLPGLAGGSGAGETLANARWSNVDPEMASLAARELANRRWNLERSRALEDRLHAWQEQQLADAQAASTGTGAGGQPPPTYGPPFFYPNVGRGGDIASQRFAGAEGLLPPTGFPSRADALRQQVEDYERALQGDVTQVDKVTRNFDTLGQEVERVTSRYMRAADESQIGPTVTTRETIFPPALMADEMRAAQGMGQVMAEVEDEIRRETMYESIRQGRASALTLVNERNLARVQGETLADVEDMTDRQRQPLSDPGRGFPYLRQQYLQQEVSQAAFRLSDANAAYRLDRTDANANAVEKASRSYQSLQKELEGASSSGNKMVEMWQRHLYWITQTILIMGTLRAAYALIEGYTQTVNNLANAQARLAAVGGVTPAQARGQAVDAVQAGAEVGIRGEASLRGAVVARQLRLSAEDVAQARQVAVAFGADYVNILEEINQTNKRAAAAGLDHVNTLDTLATMFKTSDQPIETYFDALQQGIQVYQQLGVSAEQAGVLILGVATSAEISAEQASTVILRLAQIWQRPAQLEQLRGFGVTGAAPAQGIPQIAQIARDLTTTGQTEKLAEFYRVLAQGSIDPTANLKQLPLVLAGISDSLQQGTVQVGAWADFWAKVGGTPAIEIQKIQSAWDALLVSFANTAGSTGALSLFLVILKGIGGEMEKISRLSQFKDQEQGGGVVGRAISFLIKYGGLGAVPFMGPILEESAFNLLPEYQRYTAGGSDRGSRAAKPGQAIVGSFGGQELGAYQEPPIGGIRPTPEGFNVQKVQAEVDRMAAVLRTIPGIADEELKAVRTYFIDPLTGQVEVITGPAQALALALTNATQAAIAFGGFGRVPESLAGISQTRLQAAVNREQGRIERIQPGRQDYEQQQERIYYDPSTGRNLIIRGSAEAVSRALDGLTNAAEKTTRAFGGFQTLPEGVSVSQLQGAANVWQRRIAGAEPGFQDYEKQQVTMFWDAGTRTFRPVVASVDALRFATEDLNKTQKQITGVFNVPVGGEVQVAFAALQAGFVPSNRLPGGAGGAGDLAGAGNELKVSATAHENAAKNLSRAATLLSAAASILRAGGSPDTYQEYLNRYSEGESDFIRRTADLRRIMPSQLGPPTPPGEERFGGARGRALGPSSFQSEVYRRGAAAAPNNFYVNLTNRNSIFLDGRLIATQINRQNYNQLAQVRRSTASIVGA